MAEHFESHTAALCQRMPAGADCNERVLCIGNNLDSWPPLFANDGLEAQIDRPGTHKSRNCLCRKCANCEFDLRVRRVESLQQAGELHVRYQALQNAEMQTASDDTILRSDRLNAIIQQREATT